MCIYCMHMCTLHMYACAHNIHVADMYITCICMCTCVYMYVCTCMCVRVCIYTHVYIMCAFV